MILNIQHTKRNFEYSLICLYTFPAFFVIICSLLSVKEPTLFGYIDTLLILFTVLLIGFVGLCIYTFRQYEKADRLITTSIKEEEYEEVAFSNIVGQKALFKGDISTSEDILILGDLIGNISTDGNVFVEGSVSGEIICANLALHSAKVQGDVKCYGTVTMDEVSIINGNVRGEEVDVPGTVNGSIYAVGKITLADTTKVYGNLGCKIIFDALHACVNGELFLHD